MPADCVRRRIATAAVRLRRAPRNATARSRRLSLRQQVQRDGRGERQDDWKRQQHHARSGLSAKACVGSDPNVSMSSEPADWCTR